MINIEQFKTNINSLHKDYGIELNVLGRIFSNGNNISTLSEAFNAHVVKERSIKLWQVNKAAEIFKIEDATLFWSENFLTLCRPYFLPFAKKDPK